MLFLFFVLLYPVINFFPKFFRIIYPWNLKQNVEKVCFDDLAVSDFVQKYKKRDTTEF